MVSKRVNLNFIILSNIKKTYLNMIKFKTNFNLIFLFSTILLIFYSCSNTDEKISLPKVEGSPAYDNSSIEIKDINNIWIYLISLKEQNVFEDDNIVYQSILRFEFDNYGILISKDFLTEDNFAKIDFSNNKTRVVTDNYTITDQIYETFMRNQ